MKKVQSLCKLQINFRARLQHIPHQTENLTTGDINQLLVPVDWVFLPLVELYSKTVGV